MKNSIILNKLKSILFSTVLVFILSCSNDSDSNSVKEIYLNIPDENFETRLIALGIDSDGIINQKLLKTEAEKVTHLDLYLSSSFGKISDLSGLEGFTQLTYLTVDRQNIQEIDLSKNIELDTLNLFGNNLSSLDISHNTNLILLNASSNNLSSIEGIAAAQAIHTIDLSWNNFEEINIQNQAVEILFMSNNLLKSINTIDAPNLKNVMISNNQISFAEFSSNTLLETLLISGNKLSNLAIEQNQNLTHLYASSNWLTALDVSNNLNLIDLRVHNNPDLTCIKINDIGQIPSVSLSDYQTISTNCD